MIKIEIIDETYFKPSNLKYHYDKHILGRLNDEYPMDDMSDSDYNELGNQLSLAKCDSTTDKYSSIIGYKAADGDCMKHDEDSKLMVKYNYDRDETITLFKMDRDEFMQRVENGSSDNPKCYRVDDIPKEEMGNKDFDYDTISKKLGIDKQNLKTWRTDDISALILDIQPEKFNTLTRIYSKNPLGNQGRNVIRLRDYTDKNLTKREKINARRQDNPMIGRINVKFKVVGYGCNQRIEAVKIKFTDSSYPDIIKDRQKDNTLNDIVVLSVANAKVKKKEANDLAFEQIPYSEQKQFFYTVGFYIDDGNARKTVFTNVKK